MKPIHIGILTVSDTCYAKEKQDLAGPKLQEEIEKYFENCIVSYKIVPDEVHEIEFALKSWSNFGLHSIFTVGGTGFSPRDVTPEATRLVIEKEAPGIAYAMISRSLAVTEMAMLSRSVCGIRDKTLIINLPGSTKGAVECFGFVKSSIPHAIALLTDHKEHVIKAHTAIQATSTPSKVTIHNAANRNRKSPFPMLEVSDAFQLVLKHCTPTSDTETIPFDQAMDRILAEDVFAEDPIPPFRASIKDGYAVSSADGVGERMVRNVTAAGDEPCADDLRPGEVTRISTGAPLPQWSDAVVQVEDTTLITRSPDGTQEEVIRIDVAPSVGQDIRAIGSDIAAGTLVLHKFDRITPAYIGVLAMLGKTEIEVFKRKSIGILSTGNELKHPSENLKPGQIRDSNKFVLANLLKRYSYISVDCGTVKDEPNYVKYALEKAFSSHDIVITTGGVSMGEFDILKPVLLEDFGATIHFARINMKPGKPTTFATLNYQGHPKIFFGLPGNPVSCCVTSLLLVIPTLRYLERSSTYQFPVVTLEVDGALVNNDVRPEYHRVRVTRNENGNLIATSTGKQISSRLNSLVGANGLALVKKNDPSEAKTSKYRTIIFEDLI